MTADQVIGAAKSQTVQSLPSAGEARLSRFFALGQRGPLLPPWGTREREFALRELYRNDFNWLVRGAFAGVMTLIATTPWEIKGPYRLGAPERRWYEKRLKQAFRASAVTSRPDIEYWQAVLRHAHFGRGWNDFIRMGVDYLRQDAGWFIEIIAPGDPNEPPTGPVVGLAHIDSLRCIPTGDPEYPAVYLGDGGRYHQLHRTRVINLQDMPENDASVPGYGMCALSRAASIANTTVLMERYNAGRFDDNPPPGIVVASNISKRERDEAWRAFQAEQRAALRPQWGKQLWFYGLDAQAPAKIETLTFQQPPEAWDYPGWVEIMVKELALTLGVDIQELWELSGDNIGSATQSAILHAKSRGKTIGNLRVAIERAINDILPEPYEFRFSFTDYEQDAKQAAVANSWIDAATRIEAILGRSAAAQLLVNTITEIRDAYSQAGDSGQAIVDDIDVGAEPSIRPQVDTTSEPGGRVGVDVGGRDDADLAVGSKAIQATRLNFEETLGAVFAAAQRGELAPRRLGVILRAEIKRFGTMAFIDGVRDGGVEINKIEDEEDRETFNNWLAEQFAFISDLMESIQGSKLDPYDRARMWSTKSLMAIYQAGVASANANSLYKWVLGNTREHCRDCLHYNNQVHRMRTWIKRNIMPGSSWLECGGFHCRCKFVRAVGERASGRL